MKKITLIAALAFAGITFAQDTNLPIDFESGSDAYDDALFGGLEGSVIANPDVSGANTTANVFSATKPTSAETFAGVAFPQSSPVDFSESQLVKMTVWAPSVGTKYTVKIEDAAGNDGPFIQLDATTTGAMEWEVLEFDFSGVYNPSLDYVNVVVFPELDAPGTGDTYFFDELFIETNLGVDNNASVALSLFPNPVTTELNIEAKTAIQNVTIFNILGQQVRNVSASGVSTRVDVADLKAGAYIAQVQTAAGSSALRFIKQ